ncbi:permeability factor 2-like [Arapaima gigas]
MKFRVSSIVLVICLVIMMTTKASCRSKILRCRCIKSLSICPRNMDKIEVLQAGSHCSRVQMIATMKNGQQLCLEPTSPKVKSCLRDFMAQNKTTFPPWD